MSVLMYIFEGRMDFFKHYFPSAKLAAFPRAERRERLALEISLPNSFLVGCLGLMRRFSVSMCLVPRVPSRGPGGVCWCQGEELEPHGAQWQLLGTALTPPSFCLGALKCPSSPSDGADFGEGFMLPFLFQKDFVILRG